MSKQPDRNRPKKRGGKRGPLIDHRLIKRSMIARGIIWLGMYTVIDTFVDNNGFFTNIPQSGRYGAAAVGVLLVIMGMRNYLGGMRHYVEVDGNKKVFVLDLILVFSLGLSLFIQLPGSLNYSISIAIAITTALFIDRWFLSKV